MVPSDHAILTVGRSGKAAPSRYQQPRDRGSRTRGQKILLGVQVSLTLALISASSLFTASMQHLDELNLGVKTRRVGGCAAPVPGVARVASRAPYFRELLRQVSDLPRRFAVAISDSHRSGPPPTPIPWPRSKMF